MAGQNLLAINEGRHSTSTEHKEQHTSTSVWLFLLWDPDWYVQTTSSARIPNLITRFFRDFFCLTALDINSGDQKSEAYCNRFFLRDDGRAFGLSCKAQLYKTRAHYTHFSLVCS